MRYTSSEANKLLRRLTEERDALLVKELKSSTFLAAMGEDVDSVRPDYDYAQTQKELEELDRKIRMVKHAINGFNVSHEVQGFDMTIDQMLVYIPQLTSKKKKLSNMKSRLPKQREMAGGFGHTGSIIDYCYANYNIGKAEADYAAVSDERARAQTALDAVNSIETMEIDL